MKRFNTPTVKDLLDTDLSELLINEFIVDNQHVEYMSNYAINLVNEIRCGWVTLENWAIMVLSKALIEGKFPELKDCNRVENLKKFAIFNNRVEINSQIEYLNNLIAEKNSGLNEFSDKKFTLFSLDDDYKNNAYYLFKENKISPVFYIQGLDNKKFIIDDKKVKEYEYKRFITLAKIISKLHKEVKNNANSQESR